MVVTDIDAYRRLITDSYDERSKSYNESAWHRSLAKQLVDYAPPNIGDRVLDIGTGTGTVAFHSASIVGPNGNVTAIDISTGMIGKAGELLKRSMYNNIAFQVADAENLPFSRNTYDRIYCASAFFWISDKEKTLKHWFEVLAPGGIVGFHAWPEDSYVFGYVARQVLMKYGITYLAHSPTGNKDKCSKLLENAGYEHINIIEVEGGSYITLETAKDCWINEDHYPIGQYPHPLKGVPPDVLEQARRDYDAEMEKRNTDKGVWNNTTLYYVYGRKPSSA
jgi:ubiquinone/menaquinone biosynthesis C-methylase UbiE